MSQLLNTFQAAKILDYHPQTVRNLARVGILPAIKRRQAWFFDPSKLQAWLLKQEQGGDNNGTRQVQSSTKIMDL